MRLFLLGLGTLPSENKKIANAGGLRTEQFLTGILAKKWNGEIFLATIENDSFLRERKENIFSETSSIEFVSYGKQNILLQKTIKKDLIEFQPDVVIGVNTFASFIVSKIIPKNIPFWADNNGWILSEMQAQAYGMNSNVYLRHGMEREKNILERADKISVVSVPQKFSTLGELGIMSKLTKENFGENIVEVVPNACLPLLTKNIKEDQKTKKQEKIFRGKIFPEDAFALLWIGGFNAWADEKTLFEGIEKTMAKVSNFHFVMTGESLLGIDELQYPRFQERVKNSSFSHRVHFLGWIDGEKIPFLFSECDAGINVDRMCAETETGARNRINEFLRYDLPIITTRGTEISKILEEKNAGKLCESGNSDALFDAIFDIVSNEHLREILKKNGKELMKKNFSAIITMKPLLLWLENPKRTPYISLKKFSFLFAGVEYMRKRGIRIFLQKCLQKIFEKIG